jgi:serine-type D-Ala-D-Ala carboxypeptidase/endopeptidase
MQGGGRVMATRLDAASAPAVPALSAAQLAEYAGTYPLVPGFELKVAAIGDALTVQGTDQPAIVVEAVGKDRFSAAAVGAQFEFERDVRGKVIALVLRQNGQVLHGDRQ